MRINKIKLAGFKSFVDPTTLNLPYQLTGIVGPNGCGKSNVIDAVLWVLGESSAKHLRGDAMSDVIFSGSNARKPVGQASVEIIFDNSDGKIGGEYARYNEISIKRQLGRDGVSLYFLNGNRCRRKDITNLFLGTGIGPRSYSVIEQGMISRVIESKPEELRVFLEEAAGISKYKERRRETENRIRHTKENLERLTDIREELGKQLNRLERQAKAAERYKELKSEERRVRAELTALSWKELHNKAEHYDRQIAEGETKVEAAIADVRAVEAEIEKDHQSQIAANDRFNEVQGNFYGIGAEITRLEQAIQHATERRQALEQDAQRVSDELREIEQQIAHDQKELEQTTQELEAIEPEQGVLKEKERETSEKLEQSEKLIQSWQSEWDAFQQRNAEFLRNEQTEKSRISHLEKTLANINQRIERLKSEKTGIIPEQLGFNLDDLQTSLSDAESRYEALAVKRNQLQDQIQQAREEVQITSTKLDELRHEYQTLKGRLASLEALQQSALGQDQRQVQELLHQKGLDQHTKLAQEVTVESGWETALEIVLGEHLDSLCIDDLARFGDQMASLTEGVIGGIEHQAATVDGLSESGITERLLDKVNSDLPLATLMPGVYVAENLEQALTLRSGLKAHESVVTKQGDRVGPAWIRLNRAQDKETGVFEREREIRDLIKKTNALETRIEQLAEELEKHRERRGSLEKELANLIREMDEAQKKRAALSSDFAASKARIDQAQSRIFHIEQELEELTTLQEKDNKELELARKKVLGLQREGEELRQQQELLNRQREEHNNRIAEIRQAWKKLRDTLHDHALRGESLRSRNKALEQSLQRYRMQQEQLNRRLQELTTETTKSEGPVAEFQKALEQTLSKRLTVEAELSAAREALQAVENRLKESDRRRQQIDQVLEAARSKLEQTKMDAQGVKVRLQGLEEQLREGGFEAQSLLDQMPEDATESLWQEKLENLERKITRLGPINLAAIDECKELSERKVYLDKQHEDLIEALETLEGAIRKIDRETRGRFKEIYDQVNTGFQAMFPRLFGGGKARLELTGEDLLETGIAVIAQPPGKRNSSIHLLSGGEKALTAVSLVFAIFQLNPAPFCLLDEVDAPLDDANVVRLCDMLKEMSEQVQFVIITHNKITMEIAQQLVGVTMQEAGVSRLVSVDMEEAMEMVATG